MVASSFTEKAQKKSANPDFNACAQACFKGAHLGMKGQQMSAVLENMKASGLESSQPHRGA